METTPHSSAATTLLTALAEGRVSLHPTDTIPGLTFDPRLEAALASLALIKTRDDSKSFIGLVQDVGKAKSFWRPLPPPWPNVLEDLWPGPLSVIWGAAHHVPPAMISVSGGLCLRVPRLAPTVLWLRDVLGSLTYPMPTTSVNRSGDPPARTWADACVFAREVGVTIPTNSSVPLDAALEVFAGSPSTVIEITGPGEYRLIRQGALSKNQIDQAIALANS